jgi:hypothetical protein
MDGDGTMRAMTLVMRSIEEHGQTAADMPQQPARALNDGRAAGGPVVSGV